MKKGLRLFMIPWSYGEIFRYKGRPDEEGIEIQTHHALFQNQSVDWKE